MAGSMPESIKELQLRIDELEREFHETQDSRVRKELERLSQELARLKVDQAVDSKEKALVKEIRSKIIRNKYDETDILGLLILLREHSSLGSATREFADFVAHREKSKGTIHNYLVDGIEKVHRVLNKQLDKQAMDRPLGFGSVYSSTDLKDSLNHVLSMIGVANVDSYETNDILLCIMCLLQDVRIVQRNVVIGVLELCYTERHIQLYGRSPIGKKFVTFPVLAVPNQQNERLKEFEHTIAKSVRIRGRQHEEFRVLNNVISARCHNGCLTLFQGDPLSKSVPALK
jgi:hypothetical protein